MRSIINKKSSLNPNYIFLAVIATIFLGVGVYFWYQQQRSQQPTPQTNNESTNNQPTKEDMAKSAGSVNATPESIPLASDIAITITKLEQSNGSVVIVGNVTKGQEGTCVAQFTTPEDRPITKEAVVINDANQTTCGPISIDEVEFSYLGSWSAKLIFYTKDGKGKASSQIKTIIVH